MIVRGVLIRGGTRGDLGSVYKSPRGQPEHHVLTGLKLVPRGGM
jgi:hypothetical protein